MKHWGSFMVIQWDTRSDSAPATTAAYSANHPGLSAFSQPPRW